jgi:hypothetical protein
MEVSMSTTDEIDYAAPGKRVVLKPGRGFEGSLRD